MRRRQPGAQIDRQARARARPNGAPLPGPQERPRPAGAPGGVVEEREPRRDRRSPAADAAHLEVSRLAIHLILRALCCFAPSPSAPDGSSDASPPTTPPTPYPPWKWTWTSWPLRRRPRISPCRASRPRGRPLPPSPSGPLPLCAPLALHGLVAAPLDPLVRPAPFVAAGASVAEAPRLQGLS